MARHALRVAEPEAVPHAGAEGLDDDVRARDELAGQREVVRRLEVQRDRALAAVEPEEVARAPAARVVAPVRPLHLDHVGAEVGERLRRDRPGEDPAEVGHEHATAHYAGCAPSSSPTCTSAAARRPTCSATPPPATRCSNELDGAGRLVLLGDALELRHGAVPAALEAAREAFCAIGEALGDRAEVVLVAGNHDHAIVAPWLERRAIGGEPSLGLEQRTDPRPSSSRATLAGWLGADRTTLAYPGLWLRDDVYATHGHYLDRHVTVPTFERLAAGAMARVVGEMPADDASPEDYEAALAPLYAWLHVVSRYTKLGFERQKGTQNAWRLLTDSGPRPLRDRALVAAFPMAIRVLNMMGVGPVGADLSPAELRRAGLRAMHETCRRLGVTADWVLFGHTHRAGPLDGDDEGRMGGRRAGPAW